MNDSARRQLAEIRIRHQRRRRCPTPDEVIELMEDCEALMRLLAQMLKRDREKHQ